MVLFGCCCCLFVVDGCVLCVCYCVLRFVVFVDVRDSCLFVVGYVCLLLLVVQFDCVLVYCWLLFDDCRCVLSCVVVCCCRFVVCGLLFVD